MKKTTTNARKSSKKTSSKKALTTKASSAKTTFVSFLLDETGSMQSCLASTISGFNEYVQSLRGGQKHGDVSFTLVKFNSERTQIVHQAVPMKDVAELDESNYQPGATTPLYDAIGRTVTAMEAALKRVKAKAKAKVLVVIMTDGQENASKEYDQKKIFSLIEAKKKEGWLFVFMGADQDAYAAAADLGVGKGSTMSYASQHTGKMYRTLAGATNRYMAGSAASRDFFTPDDLKQAGASTPDTDKKTT